MMLCCNVHVYMYNYLLNYYCCVTVQGYYGCAVGKAKQAAKTEIEKLKV